MALLSFSFLAAAGFLLVNVVDPYSGATAAENFTVTTSSRFGGEQTQKLVIADTAQGAAVTRDAYTVKEKPKPPPPPPVVQASDDSAASDAAAPVASAPDPGSAQAIARADLQAQGMGDDQFSCLVSLWNRESGWNVHAANPSGAYGIPQALPGSKMSSAGPDWQNNASTQISWGLGYIFGRYGSPCGAWAHSQSDNWY